MLLIFDNSRKILDNRNLIYYNNFHKENNEFHQQLDTEVTPEYEHTETISFVTAHGIMDYVLLIIPFTLIVVSAFFGFQFYKARHLPFSVSEKIFSQVAIFLISNLTLLFVLAGVNFLFLNEKAKQVHDAEIHIESQYDNVQEIGMVVKTSTITDTFYLADDKQCVVESAMNTSQQTITTTVHCFNI